MSTSDAEADLLRDAGEDRAAALGKLLETHKRRLLKMVHLRMDPRMKARVGASDVLQDAFVEVHDRIDAYIKDPRMPFFLWLRFITAQRMVALHRRHVAAKKRDVRRQVSAGIPGASTVALADHLMAHGTTPTQAMMRDELRRRVEEGLDQMSEGDREVLVLRHFEELTNVEAAAELGIEAAAASKRYVRALKRMRELLQGSPEA